MTGLHMYTHLRHDVDNSDTWRSYQKTDILLCKMSVKFFLHFFSVVASKFFVLLDFFKKYDFLVKLTKGRIPSLRSGRLSSPRKQGRPEGISDKTSVEVHQTNGSRPSSRSHLNLPQTDRDKKQSQHWAIPYETDANSLKNLLKIMPVVLSIVQLSCLIR